MRDDVKANDNKDNRKNGERKALKKKKKKNHDLNSHEHFMLPR